MKIGIITLVGSDNCGSLLQTYALQTYLEKHYDCTVDVIDYQDKVSARTYGIVAPAILMRPIQLFRTIQYHKRLISQKEDYARFRRRYIHLTEKSYRTVEDLRKESWTYDILISGSDQVWNWPEAYIDETYFLSWAGDAVRKIAYAPSTGGSIDPKDALTVWTDEDRRDLKKIHDLLHRYQMISVREESGKRYLDRILAADIPIVADPTLMLDKKDWDKIVPERAVEGRYIFYYSYGYKDQELNGLVKRAADILGLPVYVINASLWNHTKAGLWDFKIHKDGGPLAYLSLMKYAEYVFAESFHGCIFAFIFKKNFWFLNDHSDGKVEPRIKSLLENFSLMDRILHKGNFDTTDLKRPIDYAADFDRLESLRDLSKDFMDRAVGTDIDVRYPEDALEYRIAMATDWIAFSDEKIKDRFKKIKPMAERFMRTCSDKVFDRYLHVPKADFLKMDEEEYLEALKESLWYKEQAEHRKLRHRFGYLGHLFYRTSRKYREGGMRAVVKGVMVKYKWWFRIGY